MTAIVFPNITVYSLQPFFAWPWKKDNNQIDFISILTARVSVRWEPISESCEITQANNLNRRRRLSRKAQ